MNPNMSHLLWLCLIALVNGAAVPKENGLSATTIRKRSYSLSSNDERTKNSVIVMLARPYVIPVFGAAGKIPIYYAPQPILINPGSPPANPIKRRIPSPNLINDNNSGRFKGPQYLPPNAGNKTEPNLNDKFGMQDSGPVWDTGRRTTAAPPASRPTRLPAAALDLPPLVHNKEQEAESAPTAKPGPNNCVWAIVNCCSVANTRVVESCFEQRGCPGPFWGRSPCDNDFSRAALASALNYYNN